MVQNAKVMLLQKFAEKVNDTIGQLNAGEDAFGLDVLKRIRENIALGTIYNHYIAALSLKLLLMMQKKPL